MQFFDGDDDQESDNYSFDQSISSNDDSENESNIRINTAPVKPLSAYDEFKNSLQFILLEKLVIQQYYSLKQKQNLKLDLDSLEGQKYCKKYLSIVEQLQNIYQVNYTSRKYREHFSEAYKVLYNESEINYLIEILDSAQESFPFLYVNGEKFEFSEGVLSKGTNLISALITLQVNLKNIYQKLNEDYFLESKNEIFKEIKQNLYIFDKN